MISVLTKATLCQLDHYNSATLCQLDHYNSATHAELQFTQENTAKYVQYKLLGTTPLAGARNQLTYDR